jgi:hypothetical protein
VEREIQEFKAKKAQESRGNSRGSDSQGNMERGRPRESEIGSISLAHRKSEKKSESPARTSLSSLGNGYGVNKDNMIPFFDERLSNINDSRAQIAPVNQSNLENLASVFESIDPAKPMKKNIKDMNDSLAEIE